MLTNKSLSKFSLSISLMIIISLAAANKNLNAKTRGFEFAGKPPDDLSASSAFIGRLQDDIIIAGGIYLSSQNDAAYSRDIYVGAPQIEGYSWRKASVSLLQAVSGGITIPLKDTLLFVGGHTPGGVIREIIALKNENDTITTQQLALLPESVEVLSGCAFNDTIYIFTYTPADGSYTLWSFATVIGQWKQEHTFDAPYVLVCQNNGWGTCLYLIATSTNNSNFVYSLDKADTPTHLSEVAVLPGDSPAVSICPVGDSHLLCLTDEGSLLAYHTITDTWVKYSRLDFLKNAVLLGNINEPPLLIHRNEQLHITGIDSWVTTPNARHIIWPDYLVLFLYLFLLVGIGFYFSRREKTTENYFLGGRRIPWWAAGLSIMATQVSSIGFMAIPAKSFATNWQYFVGVLGWFVAVPVVTMYFIPFFRRLNITTAYEYLEHRFGYAVRVLVSLLFLLMQLARMAIVLYLPSLALASVTGMDQRFCVVIMGVLCTIYTVTGGIEAVIWTDVIQAVLMIGGALLCIFVVLMNFQQGPTAFFHIAFHDNKFNIVQHGFNPALPVLWVILVGNVSIKLSALTSDQTVVQRYLTTSTQKQAARSLWLNVAASIPWAVIVFFLGTALYVFYKIHPEQLDPNIATDGMVPLFIAQQLPPGVSGLVIAGIFAAAMSSLDSSIHSSATVLVNDFYARLFPTTSEKHRLVLARVLVVILGLFATNMALIIAGFNIASLWDVFLAITGLIAGPIAGVFFLGIFTRRADGCGALMGIILGVIILWLAQRSGIFHFFLYTAIGLLASLISGYTASLCFQTKHSLANHNR
ncbi:MAG: sodium/solute symporter [Sedimentisphaerales bacterium]|nr:sodium/solute symporter [Sedimentisphaerales bacterium]